MAWSRRSRFAAKADETSPKLASSDAASAGRAAGADLRDDFVNAVARAGSEGQVCVIIGGADQFEAWPGAGVVQDSWV